MNHASTEAKITGPEGSLELSDCAREYLDLLLDPCTAPPACLPKTDGQSSLKFRCWYKGTLQTKTSGGWGYVMINPFGMLVNNYVAESTGSGSVCVSSAGTTTADGTLPNTSNIGVAGGDFLRQTNTPYTTSQFQAAAGVNKFRFRLVSACLRIMEVSTVMNAGGYVYGLCAPDHGSLGGRTTDELGGYEQVFRKNLSNNKWIELLYNGAVHPTDSEYLYLGADGNDPLNPSNNWCMALLINSATGASYCAVEAYATYEIIGAVASGAAGAAAGSSLGKTPSGVDEVGANLVLTALQRARIEAMPDEDDGGPFRSRVKRLLLKVASSTVTRFAPAAGAFLGSLVAPGIGGTIGARAAAQGAAVAAAAMDRKRKKLRTKAKRQALKAKAAGRQ